jgi:hypothetical protein
MSQPTWRRGLVWKDEKLYAFEHQSLLVMRMWPDMLAWRRTKTKPWAATRRYADERIAGDLLKPGEIERYALFRTKLGGPLRWDDCFDRRKLDFAALLPAYQSIPDRERGIASKFCDRRWHVLALMARCPGAADLMEANAALGYMLANSWVLKSATPTQPMRAARAVLGKSQTDILSWLDLPGTERVRRILQKIEPQALQGRTLPLLQRALWRPELQDMLAHLPRISADVLRFVQDQDSVSRLTPRFLAEVASQSTRHPESDEGGVHRPVGLWIDAIRMARHIGSPSVKVLRSVGQLRRWHDEVVRDYNRALAARDTRDDFPEIESQPLCNEAFCYGSAPFGGTADIRPIQTFGELLAEGLEMQHCVASYHWAVAAGDYFVYRVERPMRGTLGIIRKRGIWTVDQLVGPRNRRVPASIREGIWTELCSTSPTAA